MLTESAAFELDDVSFAYGKSNTRYEVFKNVTLRVARNEFFCVVGPSGCGKTTLLNILAGFETPSCGCVLADGKPITGISHKRAIVFQQDAVFPWLTVFGNCEYGPKVRGVKKQIRDEKVTRLLELVGLSGFVNAYPRELSGGMKKRLDLARALANDPDILLMDEPFGSLDALTKERLQLELMSLWEKQRLTVVFITHDLEEALFLADRVAIMQPNHDKGCVFDTRTIPFDRPREIYLKETSEFQSLRRKLIEEFKLLKEQE